MGHRIFFGEVMDRSRGEIREIPFFEWAQGPTVKRIVLENLKDT